MTTSFRVTTATTWAVTSTIAVHAAIAATSCVSRAAAASGSGLGFPLLPLGAQGLSSGGAQLQCRALCSLAAVVALGRLGQRTNLLVMLVIRLLARGVLIRNHFG